MVCDRVSVLLLYETSPPGEKVIAFNLSGHGHFDTPALALARKRRASVMPTRPMTTASSKTTSTPFEAVEEAMATCRRWRIRGKKSKQDRTTVPRTEQVRGIAVVLVSVRNDQVSVGRAVGTICMG